MRDPRLGVGVLILLAAQHVQGQDVPSGAALSVGERVRVEIARRYRADRLALDRELVAAPGKIVRRDGLTLTILSRDGRETRYPEPRARLEGRLTAFEADCLTLDLGDGRLEVRVPRLAIDRLEVPRGTRTLTREGAALGALMPGVPLGFIGMFFASFRPDCESNCPPESAAYVGAALGVAIGVGLGALVGSQIRVDRWEKVSVSVSVGPRPGNGVGGAISLRF